MAGLRSHPIVGNTIAGTVPWTLGPTIRVEPWEHELRHAEQNFHKSKVFHAQYRLASGSKVLMKKKRICDWINQSIHEEFRPLPLHFNSHVVDRHNLDCCIQPLFQFCKECTLMCWPLWVSLIWIPRLRCLRLRDGSDSTAAALSSSA